MCYFTDFLSPLYRPLGFCTPSVMGIYLLNIPGHHQGSYISAVGLDYPQPPQAPTQCSCPVGNTPPPPPLLLVSPPAPRTLTTLFLYCFPVLGQLELSSVNVERVSCITKALVHHEEYPPTTQSSEGPEGARIAAHVRPWGILRGPALLRHSVGPLQGTAWNTGFDVEKPVLGTPVPCCLAEKELC